ncbi:MAG: hypothetical protein ACI9G1_001772 [Pirellulaceae bacterium]|jgi:hypothetical protein
MFRRLTILPAMLLAFAFTADANAQCGGASPCGSSYSAGCAGAPSSCGGSVHYVQKTIYVPQWTTERRSVSCTEYRNETRTRTYNVARQVPQTKQVSETVTVYNTETRSREEAYSVRVPFTRSVERNYNVTVPTYRDVVRNYTVRVPVWSEVDQTYAINVPHQETREGMRQVAQYVPEVRTRTVCRDVGYWETRIVASNNGGCGSSYTGCGSSCRRSARCGGCGGCGSACGGCGSSSSGRCGGSACGGSTCGGSACGNTTSVARVWVPSVIQEQIAYTVNRCIMVNQPYTYNVTVNRPEIQVRKVRVCNYSTEVRTKTEKVCEYRTETRTKQVQVTDYHIEQRTRSIPYSVSVPSQREVTRTVTYYETVNEERTQDYTVCVPVQVQREVSTPVCRMVPQTVTVPTTVGHSGCGGGSYSGSGCSKRYNGCGACGGHCCRRCGC